jgi:non-specific serine/threonine protein kinase
MSTASPVDQTQSVVTVLFTDAVGSTELRTTEGDETAHRLLGDQATVIRENIAAHGGREVKGTGDGVLAAFASARRAVTCAAEIQRALQLQERHRRDVNLAVRIGVNSGEVTDEGGDIFGAAVNAAARMTAKAKGGEILASAVVKQLAGMVPDVSFVDRGRFRLKGFEERWHLFEVVWQREAAPSTVPGRLSNFIGRKKEMGELRRMLAHTRLLTILGPGGAGKTRLATEFARAQAPRFADGEIMVELVEVRDPSLIPDAIARAAGIRLQAEDTVGTLVHRLESSDTLLVVDNCEHLVDGAATVLARLLSACPRLVVLATSRERLNIDGEVVWRLSPLALPGTADTFDVAAATEAVRLFVDRARNVRPRFDLRPDNIHAVIAICRRLDGMPLAIELAAARSSTLSPSEIMARLDDRLRLLTSGSRDADTRHRTLRATIDWSYELLDPSERLLLQRLSIFAGPVRADAVEQVCGETPLTAADVPNGLQQLADKSMLQIESGGDGGTRYRLLETIRDYAADKLAASEEEAKLRDRHLAFYMRLADEAFEARLRRGAMPEHSRLWEEIADVRAALDLAQRDFDTEVALLGNLKQVWMMFAPGEGFHRLADALAGVTYEPTRGYVRALWALQALIGRRGSREGSVLTPPELTELAREAGQESLIAIGYLGTAYNAERVFRDLDLAREYLEKAVQEFTAFGDLSDLAMALASIGGIELQRGNLAEAREWIQQAFDVAIEADDDYGAVGALYIFGWLEILSGHLEDACSCFSRALEFVSDNDVLSLAEQIEGIAVAGMAADPRRAVTLFGAGSKLREEVETPVQLPWSIWLEPAMAEARAALPESIADKAWKSGRAMSTGQVLALAREQPGAPRGGKAALNTGGLSKRELEVAGLVASGMTSRAIAERLFLSERTVESHLEHILTKLGFSSRTQVASWAAEHLRTEESDG